VYSFANDHLVVESHKIVTILRIKNFHQDKWTNTVFQLWGMQLRLLLKDKSFSF